MRTSLYIILFFGYIAVVFVRSLKTRRLKQSVVRELLHLHSVYYRNLHYKEQKHFEKRIIRFISLKRFYRFDKSEATDEMKILIAAAAVQITFGFPDECEYEVFNQIAVSDKEYVSQQTKKVHQGEANPGKSLIAFSWQRFMEGVKNPCDSMNLGLHEFAHALFVNNVCGYSNRYFRETVNAWHTEVTKLMQDQAAHNFFRSYAFENKMEFFAVSMEHFFENPKALHAHFPQLYFIMCRMLNQNPMLPNNGIVRKSIFSLNTRKNNYKNTNLI